MSRSLDIATFTGLDTMTGLGLPAERSQATLDALNGVLATLAALDGTSLGETPPASAFSATWE